MGACARRDAGSTVVRVRDASPDRLAARPNRAERIASGNQVIGLLLRTAPGSFLQAAAVAAAGPAGNTAVAQLVQAGNATSRRVVLQRDDPKPAPAPITPQSIGVALAGIQVEAQVKRQVTSLRPWDMFAYVPWNPSGGEKKRVFAALGKAYRRVNKAETSVQAKRAALAKIPATAKPAQRAKANRALKLAEAELTKAGAALPTAVAAVRKFIKAHLDSSRNPALADVKRRLAEARKVLAEAQRRVAPTPRRTRRRSKGRSTTGAGAATGGAAGGATAAGATAAGGDAAARQAVVDAQAALATIKKEHDDKLAELTALVDAADYAPQRVERTTTTYAVGDARAKVYDKVEAYATITASGLEGSAKLASAGGPTVAELLEKDTTLNQSTKDILKIISEFEGNFSSINTWDIADVTYGMVQWTTGASGKGDLIEALKIVKADEPAAFETRLRRYGIDVDNDGIVLTRPDGTVLHGLAAAKAVQANAKLSAVLSASGADPKIQVAQLKASYELEVRKPLASSVKVACVDGKKTVKVADIVTSEAGVGALANQTVHGGYPSGKVVAAFNAAAAAAKAKKADGVAGWSADAEQRLIEALRKADPERVAIMKKRLDNAPGSFH